MDVLTYFLVQCQALTPESNEEEIPLDLSVIIVSWNSKKFLPSCMESLYQTVRKSPMEVFVVDNGSFDGSGEWVKDGFPEVNFIENKLNLGFAKANNQALILSKGKYVLLLNPDTQVKEGTIERLRSFMDSSPEAGVVGAQLLNGDGSKQNSIANFPSLATELLNKGLLRWLFPETFPGKERDYVEPVEVDSVIGACMMVRRQAMEQVGLLDEDYFLFLEETDWCYRMKRAGWKVVHVPRAEVTHFQGKSAEREKRKARVEYYRSRYLFFKKHRGQFQWGILLVGLVFKLMVEWVSMGMACLISVFTIQRWKERFFLYTYLMVWHLKGCPEGMGLKPRQRDIRNTNIEIRNKFKMSIL